MRARPSTLRVVTAILAVAASSMAPSAAAPATLLPGGFEDQPVVGSLSYPVAMAFLPDGRLLVLEWWSARVRLIVGGALAQVDPIGVIDSVETSGFERGALGIAVDPGWPVRPYVYVFYTALGGNVRISRWTVTGDLDDPASGVMVLDPGSRRDVLRDIPDAHPAHNGGTVRFGPDGMLYAGLADDATGCAAQDTVSLRGVVVRMDVSALPPGPGGPPSHADLAAPGNPFASHADPRARLVWALGLRNPFRFHVDPEDGALVVGDVGWTEYEEVSRIEGPGRNLGWPYFEGLEPTGIDCGVPAPADPVPPLYVYDRSGFVAVDGAATIAGPPYRPACGACGFPADYAGDVFVSDYYEGFLRRLELDGTRWRLAPPVAGQPSGTDWGRGFDRVTDYAVGPDGALWYCRLTPDYRDGLGEIRRITYSPPAGDVAAPVGAPVRLEPPAPTPSRGHVSLRFTLPATAVVRLDVHDLAGRRIRSLLPATAYVQGTHAARWDGRDDRGRVVSAGVYVASLRAGGVSVSRRLVVAR